MNNNIENWNIERTISSIGQIIIPEDKKELNNKFDKKAVLIDVNSDQISSANAQLALILTVNILSRLYPVITDIDIFIKKDTTCVVDLPCFGQQSLKDGLYQLIRLIHSPTNVSIVEDYQDNYDAVLGIGNSSYLAEFAINIGSDGWLCYLSQKKEVIFGGEINPVGAYATAALGCAEIFKWVLAQTFPESLSVNINHVIDLRFSTFDYSIGLVNEVNPILPEIVDVGQTSIIGVGAGGGAIAYTLNSLKHLKGIINLVDPDTVKLSNLNRYIWAFWDDASRQMKKVDVACSLLSSTKHKELNVRKFFGSYIHFTKELKQQGGMDLVISTVDTGNARQEIQWDIPRVILDGSTTGYGDYVILRVYFGKGQCLCCKHQGKNSDDDQFYQILSDKIGLCPEDIKQLIKDGSPFSEEHITQMKKSLAKQENADFTLPVAGMSFSDWHQQQCGRLKLPELKGIGVPIPFVPTMAGILLAGEIIKERHFQDFTIKNRFSHNMLNIPSAEFLYFKNPLTNCMICQDPIMQKQYREIWHECQ